MEKMQVAGQRLDSTNYREILKRVAGKEKLTIFSLNLHTLRLLDTDKEYRNIHERASVICADGMMVVYLTRWLYGKKINRVNGTELAEKILKTGRRCFVIGPNDEVVERLKQKYKNVIDGWVPSVADTWTKEESEIIVDKVNRAEAEVVLVGVGQPKADKWIDKYADRSKARVWLAVGSSPEILAGKIRRVPKAWGDIGLEWLWRIAWEPKRLLGRYVGDFTWLVRYIISGRI